MFRGIPTGQYGKGPTRQTCLVTPIRAWYMEAGQGGGTL